LDSLNGFVQTEKFDPDFQIPSNATSPQERIDGAAESSSFQFIPLCKRVALRLGISVLNVIQFLTDNPEIFLVPTFASLIPSVNGENCMVECINKCQNLYGRWGQHGQDDKLLQVCLAACGQGCGRKEL
jgi:hypothetical protein